MPHAARSSASCSTRQLVHHEDQKLTTTMSPVKSVRRNSPSESRYGIATSGTGFVCKRRRSKGDVGADPTHEDNPEDHHRHPAGNRQPEDPTRVSLHCIGLGIGEHALGLGPDLIREAPRIEELLQRLDRAHRVVQPVETDRGEVPESNPTVGLDRKALFNKRLGHVRNTGLIGHPTHVRQSSRILDPLVSRTYM